MRTLLLTFFLWSTISFAGDFPIIIDPVVNATPPGANVAAGYFTMVNETDAEITITDAYSPTIKKVEIHRSSVENDIAKMERQDSVSVEPGATLAFEHGGYHLMLMELTEPLKADDSVDIILITSVGEMMIEMPVKKMGTAKSMSHSEHSNQSEHAGSDEDKHANDKMDHSKESHKDEDEHTSTN